MRERGRRTMAQNSKAFMEESREGRGGGGGNWGIGLYNLYYINKRRKGEVGTGRWEVVFNFY